MMLVGTRVNSRILVNYAEYIQMYRLYQVLCHLSNVNKTQPILQQPSTLPQFGMSKKRCYRKSNRFMHGFILIGVVYHPLVLFKCSISKVTDRNVFFFKSIVMQFSCCTNCMIRLIAKLLYEILYEILFQFLIFITKNINCTLYQIVNYIE